MHLEVKVALNFIVSYLYNKLPRRRADLFGEELEHILVTRFKGHWYPDAPLRGSAFRCLHLGLPDDPVVDLAAKRSGLDMEEVRANVPPELSIWIDPYEVSYQIGEKGAVKVLYVEDPPGLAGDVSECLGKLCKDDEAQEDEVNLSFNPEAQVFVPIGSQASPVMLASLSNSPTPLCQGLYSYTGSSTPTDPTIHSNTSSPPPLSIGMPYSYPSAKASSHPALQQITFTPASFAATKFGSTKMKKCIGPGAVGGSGSNCAPQQRMLSRSPTATSSISPPGLVKQKPLSLSLHSLAGPISSQLSPNAKEFVYPASQRPLCLEAEVPHLVHTGPFHSQVSSHAHTHGTLDPLTSPHPSHVMGVIGSASGITLMEGLGGYNLPYSSQVFQPVVLAN